ncbi:MAG: hypothetical protein H6712_21990 [Myxococcales bacterium]|nr:hypothetical protein [Myxococcales bacterium]
MSDPWIAEVDAALRRRIADADAQPDFLDVVARARALDPEAFDDEALQQAEALQRAHADAPALDDGPLDAWLDDARLAIDRKVEARRDQPLPPLHRAAPRRAIWWAGGALAAALLLALGIGRLMSTSASDRAEPLDQAELVSEPNDAAGDAVRSSATPRARARGRARRRRRAQRRHHRGRRAARARARSGRGPR